MDVVPVARPRFCFGRGVNEGGWTGLARGAVRGATGALVRPLAAALEASATFADGIRKAVGGGGGSAVR